MSRFGGLPPFWMREPAGGPLRPAVKAYFDGDALTPEQIEQLRTYLVAVISAPVWIDSQTGFLTQLRAETAMVSDRASIEKVIGEMLEHGIDPL